MAAEDALLTDKPKKAKKTKTKSKQPDEEIPLETLETDSPSHGSSRAKFDVLLQQAYEQVSEEVHKKKKKKKPAASEAVLESLRKGEGLQKEEDAAIKANTYDPDDGPKNEKSNKRRQQLKESALKEPKPFNKGNIQSIDESQNKDTKKKKKKSKPEQEETVIDRDMTISELTTEPDKTLTIDELAPQQKGKKKKKKIVTEEEEPLSPKEDSAPSPKAKPRKKKPQTDEEEPLSPRDDKTTPQKGPKKKDRERVSSPVSEQPAESKTVKKKKKDKDAESEIESPRSEQGTKKKKKVKKGGEEITSHDEEETAEKTVLAEGEEESTPKKKKKKKKTEETKTEEEESAKAEPAEAEDEGQVLSVMVHRTDKLKNDFHIQHPLVRVHVVNENTGQYLVKQHKDRAVTSYFENLNDKVDYVLPIMTKPFDFKQMKSILPMWEEVLIFNENYNYFIEPELKVVVFFEVLDFVSMNTASQKYTKIKQEGGWHRIAWAFLKMLGNNNKINTGGKVRLQLFEPVTGYRNKAGQVELYQWWKNCFRKNYPSTLYVTLKGVTPPSAVEPASRSMYAMQEEKGRLTYQDLKQNASWTKIREDVRKNLSSWTRLVGQVCRIPNTLSLALPAGKMGCFVLRFSHDGRSLACVCHNRENYPILVYDIPSGTLRGEFAGHFRIVYDLCWSKTDTHLLSASSDGTVRLWNLEMFGDESEKLLPHPSFVYTAQFHPRVDTIVVTGGYDQVIRVWDVQGDNPHGDLKQEIEDHSGSVNSICFDEDGQKMFSGDNNGIIMMWNVFITEQPTHRAKDESEDVSSGEWVKGFVRDWTIYQKIEDVDLKGTIINFLKLHPSGRRLLVHCRDNVIRMFDLRVQRIMQKYIGALNFREQIRSTISPCGSFVFSGSEDNMVYAWNTETGDQVVAYSELNFQQPVTDVDYHPRDHMLAMCSIGYNQPIVIYSYNPQTAQMDAGLTPRTIVPEPRSDTEDLTYRAGSPRTDELSFATGKVLSRDEFQTHSAARLEKVMKKLNTATSQMLSMPSDLPGIPTPSPRMTRTGLNTWGSTFDQSFGTPRSMTATPQAFTPHAPPSMSSTMYQQQFASQNMYMKQSDSDWRPGFSEVGRYGARSTSPTFIGRPPQISLMSSQGKAQFSYQSPAGKVIPQYKQVIALYDYRAQRSDELSIFRGDVISVLFKDSDSWWMGELPDGQQGYFPANYVAEEDSLDLDQRQELRSEEDGKKKKVTAVKSKSGELRFLSGPEDSEEELEQVERNMTNHTDKATSNGEKEKKNGKSKRRVTLNESVA